MKDPSPLVSAQLACTDATRLLHLFNVTLRILTALDTRSSPSGQREIEQDLYSNHLQSFCSHVHCPLKVWKRLEKWGFGRYWHESFLMCDNFALIIRDTQTTKTYLITVHKQFIMVVEKCKTNHDSENKITNYQCKSKTKQQSRKHYNKSENTTTNQTNRKR